MKRVFWQCATVRWVYWRNQWQRPIARVVHIKPALHKWTSVSSKTYCFYLHALFVFRWFLNTCLFSTTFSCISCIYYKKCIHFSHLVTCIVPCKALYRPFVLLQPQTFVHFIDFFDRLLVSYMYYLSEITDIPLFPVLLLLSSFSAVDLVPLLSFSSKYLSTCVHIGKMSVILM